MTRKHSSGPWKIDGQFDADVTVSIVTPDGFEVFECQPTTSDAWSEEDIANVRLAAAGPELQAVADNAMSLLRELGFDRDHPIWKRWAAVEVTL